MIDEVYLITHNAGIYQICVPSGKPIEEWEYQLIEKIKDSPDFPYLGNGKFIVSNSSVETITEEEK